MQVQSADIIAVLPEILMLVGASLVLIMDLFLRDEQREWIYRISQGTLLVTVLTVLLQHGSTSATAFGGMVAVDYLATLLKTAVLGLTVPVLAYSRVYIQEHDLFKGEYFALALFGVLGMMILISAHHLLLLYLGLELLALSLYAMVAMDRESPDAPEAAMKYFVLGALASGMFLYGASMLYGVTGDLHLLAIAEALSDPELLEGAAAPVALGLTFTVIGIGFKLGVVPFHMWIPDVYQGAPTSVTLFLGAAPKLAGSALALRLLGEGLPALVSDWQVMFAIMALLSLIVGNLVAIVQSDIKRMLAYSTIAHMGFLFMALLGGNAEAYGAGLFYVITYGLMTAGAFGVLLVSRRGSNELISIHDFNGLSATSPWLAGVMLLVMFALAGVPPTVGFYAKLLAIEVAVENGFIWLAVVAVLMSVIGAFYYLRIVKNIFFEPIDHEAIVAVGSRDSRWLLGANGILMLLLGLFPASLIAVCVQAAASIA